MVYDTFLPVSYISSVDAAHLLFITQIISLDRFAAHAYRDRSLGANISEFCVGIFRYDCTHCVAPFYNDCCWTLGKFSHQNSSFETTIFTHLICNVLSTAGTRQDLIPTAKHLLTSPYCKASYKLIMYRRYVCMLAKGVLLFCCGYIINHNQWACYQIRKIAGCACAGNTGNVFFATTG